jgi:bifunctional ADP-heptose synthase (sugar kinase/adenylyltransferase)
VENLGAPIVSFEDFDAARPDGRIVATSGGFDPIHPGHISSLQQHDLSVPGRGGPLWRAT